jgi:hypothetical protein
MIDGMANLMATIVIMENNDWMETQQFEFVVFHKTSAPPKKKPLSK